MKTDKLKLEEDLAHSRAAYLHSINALPSPQIVSDKEIVQHGMTFSKESQVYSMIIELGWAFFCRYEACFESFLKQNEVELSKKCSLHYWLIKNNVDIPEEFESGLKVYRQIRNQLHHEDGASFEEDSKTEIQLRPDHMENFYNLFIWCGSQVQTKG
jgi:hypothetical protein